MSGETNLDLLVANMRPELRTDLYAFCLVPEAHLAEIPLTDIDVLVREHEGITLVLAEAVARRYDFDVANLFACITLQVHSSLEAVGLTAVVATRLAEQGISANVIAGYYHDHIYVAAADGAKAVEILQALP
ncbi:MAG: hypothetical protein ACJAYE_001395 [Candidatus Azotimanducaceae bacterium]